MATSVYWKHDEWNLKLTFVLSFFERLYLAYVVSKWSMSRPNGKMFIVAEKLSRLFIYMGNWCPNKNILREIIMQMSVSILGVNDAFHLLFCKFAKIVPRLDFIIDFQIILRQICINFLKTWIKSNENTGPRLPYLKLCILFV